ncbi:MAG: sulfatase [Chloroflexi bacterium]|nr:sulfatase [Chloroflexota bacterium]
MNGEQQTDVDMGGSVTVPNIVFITSHDLGRHLGCYGRATVVSPHLDRLAAEGVRFANSFCTAPQCSPSRAALHTGRHAHSVRMLGLAHSPFDWHLQPATVHLAARLRRLGYHTALVGGQHVTHDQSVPELGFDHWTAEEKAAPELAPQVRSYLSALAGKQPFYLEIGFTEVHRPYDWGGASLEESLGAAVPPYIPNHPDSVAEFAALQGAIRQLDDGVGILLAALAENGLDDNTLLLFASDHGLPMPRAKCTLYDPGLETTLLLRWPAAGVAGGRVFEHLVSHVDVVPTLLEGLGQPAPAGDFHGRSFWPLLQDEPYQPNQYLFAEKTFHTAYEPMRAVRTAGYKLILNFESGSSFDVPDDVRTGLIYPLMVGQAVGHRPHVELYDLERDPRERMNLAGRPETAGEERSLRRRLRRWMEETEDPLLTGPPPSPFYRATMASLLES